MTNHKEEAEREIDEAWTGAPGRRDEIIASSRTRALLALTDEMERLRVQVAVSTLILVAAIILVVVVML